MASKGTPLMLQRLLILLMFSFLCAIPATASDLSRFNEAVAGSSDHYRASLFYLGTENPAVAGFEIAEAATLWTEAVMPFAENPPDAFADDPRFAEDLNEVLRRMKEADAKLASGALSAEAQAALDPIGPLLAALRQRNGVVVFSDHVAAANAAMERLWAFRHAPPDWSDAAAVGELTAAAAVTIHLYHRLLDTAPAAVASNPEFQRILEGALTSLDGLWEQILAANEERVISYLRELRSFDRILWLQFG